MEVTDIKDPEEVVDLSFDFTDDLGAADIQGAPVIAASLIEGVDPDFANTIQGAATVDGKIVFQRIRNGLDKVAYGYRCKITASDGRVLVLALQVPVRTL